MASTNALSYWKNCWDNGDIKFHITEPHPILLKHADKLIAGRSDIQILVPYCGKSVDMKWFYDRNHRVVGIDISETGIQSFFKEQNLEYVTERIEPDVTMYCTPDRRLKIFCCDVLKFQGGWIDPVDAVWDRGALVAVEKEDRKKYAAKILSLINLPNFTYLMEVMTYKEWFYSGCPRNVPRELVEYLYGDECHVVELETVLNMPPFQLNKRTQVDVYHVALLLTPKAK